MLVQLGPPGELRSAAEIADDVEGAPCSEMLNRYRRSGKYLSGSPSSFPITEIPITVPTGWGEGGSVKIWTVGAARETLRAARKHEMNGILHHIAAKYVTVFSLGAVSGELSKP
jgi:hypothetical protein